METWIFPVRARDGAPAAGHGYADLTQEGRHHPPQRVHSLPEGGQADVGAGQDPQVAGPQAGRVQGGPGRPLVQG